MAQKAIPSRNEVVMLVTFTSL